MADLKYIFECETLSALRHLIGRYAYGKEFHDETKLYYRYTRGEIQPGGNEQRYWLELCPQADRISKLPLWDVIGPWMPYSHDRLASILQRLSPEVTARLDDGVDSNLLYSTTRLHLPKRTVLRPLIRLCNIDALTVLLAIIDIFNPLTHPYSSEYTGRLMQHAAEAFIRLSVFPPFDSVRLELLRHVGTNYFQRQDESGSDMFEWWTDEEILQFTDETSRCLTAIGRMGLVGPAYEDQVRFVNWIREMTTPEIRETILTLDSASGPVAIQPTDPLYRSLKRIRHPATRSNRPIELPRNGKHEDDFKIAYSLVKPAVNWERCRQGRSALLASARALVN